MKCGALLLMLNGIAAAAENDLRPPNLARLLALSEAVVYGEVVSVAADTITVRIERTMKGATAAGTLELERPERFDDMPRWAAYAAGEKLLLFVTSHNDKWRLTGPSGRGEFPIVDGQVRFPEPGYLESGPTSTAAPAASAGATSAVNRVPLAEFIDAIEAYAPCFAWRPVRAGTSSMQVTCSATQIAQSAAKSPVHAVLSHEAALQAR